MTSRSNDSRPRPFAWKVSLILALCPALCGEGAPQAQPPRITFPELLTLSASGIRPTVRLRELSGHRVRMAGFMAKMEIAPKGGFYLTPRPVSCDEEGGGTADLPPGSVYVVVRSAAGQEIPYSPRALEVSGVLEVGPRQEEDQRVTAIRLLLDRPQDLLGASPKP